MKVTRRQALLIFAAAAASVLGYKLISDMLVSVPEESLRGPRKGSGGGAVVSVAKRGNPTELARRAVNGLGGLSEIVRKGDRVVVKPNVGFPYSNAVASPEVVAEVVRMAYEAGAGEVLVAESSVRGSDTTYCFKKTGYPEAIKAAGAELLDLKKFGEEIEVEAEGALKLKRVKVYRRVYEADVLISVAKMKRHSAADVTLGMKNLIGCFPDKEKGRLHATGLHECIADIAYILRPDLVVIDGTEAMLRHGPTGGKMVKGDVVVASFDPLAADYVAAKILFELEGNADPAARAAQVKHFKYAEQLGVGVMGEEAVEIVVN